MPCIEPRLGVELRETYNQPTQLTLINDDGGAGTGTLAGGAFGMALACDLRLAVPGAKFFYPVARLGYLPQPSDPGRLAALIGLARAKMILLASQKIGVEEALAWGLVDRVAEPEDLMQAAQDLCQPSLEGNPGVLRAIKGMCA